MKENLGKDKYMKLQICFLNNKILQMRCNNGR